MSRSRRYGIALPLTFVLLAAVVAADLATGWAVSFSLIYILPVTVAAWVIGRSAGIVIAAFAAGAHFLVTLDAVYDDTTKLWNTGILFGVLLTIAALVHALKIANHQFPILKTLARTVGAGLAFAVVLTTIGLYTHNALSSADHRPGEPAGHIVLANTLDAAIALPNPLIQLREKLLPVLRNSRTELLGSRDPRTSTCITPGLTGQITNKLPDNLGDYDGGPATTLALLLGPDRQNCKNPAEDFAWHQGRLRRFLENKSQTNNTLGASADAIARQARVVADTLSIAQSMPIEIVPIGFNKREDWPSYCLSSLDQAVAAHDLPAAQRWSAEFAAATFALADLHHWLTFLDDNYLTALDFQKQCQSMFTSFDPSYDSQSTASDYPAGLITLHGISNYYEVEHEAERLFTIPQDRLDALAADPNPDAASIRVPPTIRPAYRKLRQLLSPANQSTWDRAAAAPYEHTYLVNMIYRANKAGAIDQLAIALDKLDNRVPSATLSELMGVLMYRGHSFAGIEWADRFQPLLVEAADKLPDGDIEALTAACKFTNQFYHAPTAAYGVTFTLRDAIEAKRLDCVRATDMIGSIVRDSGHPRFSHVRWCAGSAGHSVAACAIPQPDGSHLFYIADGLNPCDQPEVWPSAYFNGHAWPPGMESNPTPYAVELYVRGLDNYIWAEGYIVRGPSAGTLTKAAIPYSTFHKTLSTQKVFDGPYPK